jgi:hypothetical protein
MTAVLLAAMISSTVLSKNLTRDDGRNRGTMRAVFHSL